MNSTSSSLCVHSFVPNVLSDPVFCFCVNTLIILIELIPLDVFVEFQPGVCEAPEVSCRSDR